MSHSFTIFNKSPNNKKKHPVSHQQADIHYTVLPHLGEIYESTKAEKHSISCYTEDKFSLGKVVERTCPQTNDVIGILNIYVTLCSS